MVKRICSVDGCERGHDARGYCKTHYNRLCTVRKYIDVTCPTCNEVTRKRADGASTRRFCSYMCRDLARLDAPYAPRTRKPANEYGKRGARQCKLPPDHPAIWCGAVMPVAFGPCGWCGETVCRGQAHARVYCDAKCKRKAREQRRRASEFNEHRTWSWSDFMHIARRFGFRCAYCDTKPDGQLQPDHVVALSIGGPNNVGNLLPACASCNASKSNLTLEAWAERREASGLPPRATSWPPEDRRYWHLTYLTSFADAA